MTSRWVMGLVAGVTVALSAAHAGNPPPLSGELLGQVQNSVGIAQMGASVFLYNRYDQLVRQALTNETGKFAFEQLTPGLYSIRVALASFLPAIRGNIAVAAGSASLLKIDLASMASSVEIVPASAAQGALMSDEWKWVLRSSSATRPVLRYAGSSSSPANRRLALASFSQTSGILRVSAGDGDSVSGSTAQDLGAAFALATLVNGWARVRFSGNLGYMANSGLPAAGFRATYSPDASGDSIPQVAVTVHQISFPGLGAGGSYPNGEQTGPVLRAVSFSALDKTNLTDRFELEYGGHVDSVSLMERVTYASPFARGAYNLGDKKGVVRVAFSSGVQPAELIARGSQTQDGVANQSSDLNGDLRALSVLPVISRRNGKTRLERNETWEASYQLAAGSRKYSLTAYVDDVADAAYTVSGAVGALPAANMLPDYDSTNSVYNLGSYWRSGYSASATQSAGDHLNFTVAAGRAGSLLVPNSADLQTVRKRERTWAAARASATVPASGTRVVVSYGWTDFRALMPLHVSLTGPTDQDEGLNFRVRQPLPKVNSMHGRIEATAEYRNALGQGYIPVAGGQALLTNAPRMLRGGLDFLF
ncbi:MAG TPA: carboxypeptidase-like regulatory domain-containing protein [Bryobacteraceae bacterium]|nr:carboxypeptidase-like regulatory domain-containing protein [Bryobacteraceae bacterium]